MTTPPDAAHPTPPAAKPYRIFPDDCPFRKNGTPVLGTMGSSIRRVIVIEAETWKRMIADIPALATAVFEVAKYD